MILTRFTESPKAVTLADKQRWTKLTESLAEFNTVEETLQKQDWKGYYGTRLFGGVPPEQREQTILMTLPESRKRWRSTRAFTSCCHSIEPRSPALPKS